MYSIQRSEIVIWILLGRIYLVHLRTTGKLRMTHPYISMMWFYSFFATIWQKMKKNTSWKFTDESSVTLQSSVSGAGEFGLCTYACAVNWSTSSCCSSIRIDNCWICSCFCCNNIAGESFSASAICSSRAIYFSNTSALTVGWKYFNKNVKKKKDESLKIFFCQKTHFAYVWRSKYKIIFL